jgi:hypothetical protein
VSLYTILVSSDQGYAKVSQSEFAASKVITVSPWGRIEGTLRTGAQADVDKLVDFVSEFHRGQEQPDIEFEYEVRTDKSGRFVFPQILPGKGVVARITPLDNGARRFSYHISVEVKSGETARVQIGGTGRPVIGKVVIPEMIENIFDWQYTDHSIRVSSPISPPYTVLTFECDKDGSFLVEDVPAGDYTVSVIAYGPPLNSQTYRGERIGILSRAFTIPEMPGGRSDEPFDLGELELEVVGKSDYIPSLVDKPLPDWDEIKIDPALAQADDRMILVCFFDMSQRPSRHCVTQLAEQTARLKDKSVFIVAVQVSTMDQNTLDEWVKKNNISFPVGIVQGIEEKARFSWGVQSLPWLILTNERHIVTAEGLRVEELDEKIKETQNATR